MQLVDRPWFPYLCTEVEHWRWETRGQPHYNFWVAIAGEGYLSCDGQMYPLKPGSFFVFSPGQEISAAHYSGPRITRFSAHFLPTLNGKVIDSVDSFPLTGGNIESLALFQRQIDVVMRTGGSSLIASVREQLEERFPNKVTEHDPFTSVAVGLAIASYHDYQFHVPNE